MTTMSLAQARTNILSRQRRSALLDEQFHEAAYQAAKQRREALDDEIAYWNGPTAPAKAVEPPPLPVLDEDAPTDTYTVADLISGHVELTDQQDLVANARFFSPSRGTEVFIWGGRFILANGTGASEVVTRWSDFRKAGWELSRAYIRGKDEFPWLYESGKRRYYRLDEVIVEVRSG